MHLLPQVPIWPNLVQREEPAQHHTEGGDIKEDDHFLKSTVTAAKDPLCISW